MSKASIVLFTPYPPTQGGGSQNLRCALPHLADISITWAYLSHKKVDFPNSLHLGPPLLEGGLFSSWKSFLQMSLRAHPAIKNIARRLLSLNADKIWTVAHYEGLSVADELISQKTRVHLSVHDDPPFALVGRSRRYFPFAGLCEAQFARVLRGAHSVDVTSHPMGARYAQRYGVQSVAYFPYVHQLPELPDITDTSVWRIGFLGTLYTPREAKIFAQALHILSQRTRTPVEWHFWGLGARQQAWVQHLAAPTVLHPFLSEDQLPAALVPMHALYANYPFDNNSRVFRQTSHPAKLSTYLKAQRPIFAHTPLPSSLADFVGGTGVGLVCSSANPSTVAQQLQLLLSTPIPAAQFAHARSTWYGETNLQRLRASLLL